MVEVIPDQGRGRASWSSRRNAVSGSAGFRLKPGSQATWIPVKDECSVKKIDAPRQQEILDFMFEHLDVSNPREAKLLDLLVTKRNHHMAERAAARIREQPDQSFFFALGAAHMPGDDGVVALLRQREMTVTRVVSANP